MKCVQDPASSGRAKLCPKPARRKRKPPASDRCWFEEHPHREFRIRRPAAGEIGSVTAIGALKPVPDGAARFTLVRKISSDCRMRIFIFGPKHQTGDEADEATAATLWSLHLDRNPSARERELAIKAIVSDHDLQGGSSERSGRVTTA